jgi:hypothetical protein
LLQRPQLQQQQLLLRVELKAASCLAAEVQTCCPQQATLIQLLQSQALTQCQGSSK